MPKMRWGGREESERNREGENERRISILSSFSESVRMRMSNYIPVF